MEGVAFRAFSISLWCSGVRVVGEGVSGLAVPA